jgi:asparagine synthase (glutamine-hydrolysing)
MIRCAHYRDRPRHADQLHLDLWWQGVNIACDAGTYLYNGEPPWDNGLAGTGVHNTVAVDGQDQMMRAGRFLWLDWAQGQVRRPADPPDGLLAYWEGEHDGYRSLSDPITHRRAVARLGDEAWLVVDDLVGEGKHAFCLHWLLADLPYRLDGADCRLILTTDQGAFGIQVMAWPEAVPGFSLVRADPTSVRGWQSRYYGQRDPALSLRVEMRSGAPARFVTLLAAGSESGVRGDADERLVARWSAERVEVALARIGASSAEVPMVRGLRRLE